MPRLPTGGAFGVRPTPRGARTVVPFRADIAQQAEAAGYEALAQRIGTTGQQLAGAAEAFEARRQDAAARQAAVAEAKSDYLRQAGAIDRRFEGDAAPETAPSRWRQDREALRKAVLATFPDAPPQELLADFDAIDGRDGAWLGGVFRDRQRAAALARLNERLTGHVSEYAAAGSAARRQALTEASHDLIDAARARGFLSDEEARSLRRGTAERSAIAAIAGLPAAARYDALQLPPDWDGESDVAPLAATGALAGFIPHETRLEMARAALPGVKASRAKIRAAAIAAGDGDLASWLAQASGEADPVVRAQLGHDLRQAWAARQAAIRAAQIADERRRKEQWVEAGLGADAVALEAAQIESAPVREAALRMMQTEYLAQYRADQDRRTVLAREGLAAARRGAFHGLPAATVAGLDEGTRQALVAIDAGAAGGRPAQSDPTVLLTVQRMTPEQLTGADLLRPALLRGLSAEDFDTLTARQQAIRDGDPQASADQRARADFAERLAGLGIAEGRQVDMFARLNEQAALHEWETGRPATAGNITDFYNQLIRNADRSGDTDTSPGSSREDGNLPASKSSIDNRANVDSHTVKRPVDTQFADNALVNTKGHSPDPQTNKQEKKKMIAFVGGAWDIRTRIVRRTYERTPGSNVVYFEWTQDKELADWIDANQGNDITVIGHSYGGDTAAKVVANGHKVNTLTTVDPVGSLTRPDYSKVADNSGLWKNYYSDGIGIRNWSWANLIAGIGGAYNDAPKGYADIHQKSNLDHVDIWWEYGTP